MVTPRKLILKPTRFQSPDENTPEAKLPDPKTKEKSKASGELVICFHVNLSAKLRNYNILQ